MSTGIELRDSTIAILGGNNIPSKRRLFDAARMLGVRTVLVKAEATWELDYAAGYLPLSVNNYDDIEQTTDKIVSFCRSHDVQGVITTHDSAIPVLAEVASALGLNGPSKETATALRNKAAMRQKFAELGVPSAQSIPVESLDEALEAAQRIGFPVILKPSVGTASAGVVLVHSARELRDAYASSMRVGQVNGDTTVLLVEEYLNGMEVTVDALVHNGEILFHNISDHPQPMPGPYFAQVEFVTPTSAAKEVADQAYAAHEIAIEGFGLNNNIVHTEMRFTSRGPRVIELHPRPAGQRVPEITSRSLGVNLMGAAIEIALNRRPDIRARPNGYAGYRCICPPRTGTLKAIHGVDKAALLPGIFDIEVTVPVGAPVFTLPEANQQDVAYVFGEGSTYEEARSRTAAAEDLIDLELLPLATSSSLSEEVA